MYPLLVIGLPYVPENCDGREIIPGPLRLVANPPFPVGPAVLDRAT